MLSRIARIVALSLPLLLACILVWAGGLQLHDGHVGGAGHDPAAAQRPAVAPGPSTGTVDQATLVRQLNPSVPWPVWAGLIVLCTLPAVATMLAWSGARRSRDSTFSTSGGSP